MGTPKWVERSWSESPRKDDILFPTAEEWSRLPPESKGHWSANARLHVKAEADDYTYAEGYRIGGRILASHVIECDCDQDFLVYPVIFLYRHHIELRLKRLIPIGASILDRQLTNEDEGLLRKHRIDQLWRVLRPMVKDVCAVTPAELAGIDSYIRQLSQVDENSESFRYATSRKGGVHLHELRHINLQRFTELMERLANFFFGIDCAFDDAYDAKCQMLAEADDGFLSAM